MKHLACALLFLISLLSLGGICLSITHSTVTSIPNNPAKDVSATAWNAAHTVGTGSITYDGLSGTLHGATAYVGFDSTKDGLTNYWYCDGTADEVQINLAITYTGGLGGGIVHLEQGTFTTAAEVAMNQANVILEGEGKDTLIDSATVDCKGIHVTAANCVIRHLAIDQNQAGTYNNAACYVGTGGDHCLVDALWITNSNYHTVFIEHADDVTVQNCYGDDSSAHGFFAQDAIRPRFINNTQGDCSDTSFEFYYLVYDGLMQGNVGLYGANVLDGIAVQGSSRCRIIGNEMHDMPRYGILTGNEGDVATDCDENIFMGNTLNAYSSGDRDAGICVEGMAAKTAHHLVIANNTCIGFDYGIKVYGANTFRADHLVIANNVVATHTESGRIGIGVYCSTGGNTLIEYASITGNTLTDGYLGIKLQDIDNSTISGNTVDTDTGFSYYAIAMDYANYNTVAGNTLVSNQAGNTALNIDNDSDENMIRGNLLYAPTGLTIVNANCNLNFIDGNDFHRCTTDVADAGTGTLWGANVDQGGAWDQGVEP